MAIARYLVNDVDECLPFYLALGFSEAERWGPPFAVLEREDVVLWLSGPGTSAQRALSSGAKPVPGGWNRIVIQVENIEAVLQKLGAGGKTRGEAVKGPGGTHCVLEDPSGNPIELFEPTG
jgi:catechol 2,3-dioxygenase-like lactoylglutathione lyase family enzyme